MASNTPSTRSISEAKVPVDYRLDEKTPSACDDEKAIDHADPTAKESWNNPPINKYRLCSCFTLFIAGSINPQFEKDYNQSHTAMSTVYIGVLGGATIAAVTTYKTHMSLGRVGAGFLGSLAMGLGTIIVALHPPWPAVPVAMCLVIYGLAGLDPVAVAWVGSLHHASGLLGMLQGCFGIGSTIAPLIANAIIQRGIPYHKLYFVPFALSIIGSIGFVISFWGENGAKYARGTGSSHSSGAGHAKEILRSKASWLLGVFLLANWGVESAISSWMLTYLTDARGGSFSNASIVNSMYWFSFTLGRFVLVWVDGAVPPKWRGKGPVSFFISLSIVLVLMYWLLPTFAGASTAVCLQGFFCGPLYPLMLKTLITLLPPHLHVTAVGIGTALGAVGTSTFPIAAGAIAEHRGISMIQPLIFSTYIAELCIWYFLPAPPPETVST
ncbi:MFS general substrate transporter [Tuber magnatum]|uniref:MFS general substrate transporter n=1 Tax=Tuber magnatum TaxID=42249 RepID=A0A317T0L7_9PEZI|nr:MFS general substrate transporter [Tuber magnatum]